MLEQQLKELAIALGEFGEQVASKQVNLETTASTLAAFARDLEALRVTSRRQAEENAQLQALVEIGRTINSSLEVNEMLQFVMDSIIQLSGAERSFLMLKDENGTLAMRIGRNWEKENLDVSDGIISRTIVNRVVQEGKPIITSNAQEDPRFVELESITNYKLRSILCVPLMIKDKVTGAFYLDSRIQTGSFTEAHGAMLTAFAHHVAIALEKAALFDQLQSSTQDVTQAYDVSIETWAKTLELRDYETLGHCQRVTNMTLRLAQVMGVEREKMAHIRRGAILHDVGKMGIPDTILLKPGPLNEAEWEVVRMHPQNGYEWLQPVRFMHEALDIVRFDPARGDGRGYPMGLKGERIPLAARIFSVVDVWDALVHTRPYKRAWTKEEALFYIQTQAGECFDPQVVKAFLKITSEV